jgi:hypothetical protein
MTPSDKKMLTLIGALAIVVALFIYGVYWLLSK